MFIGDFQGDFIINFNYNSANLRSFLNLLNLFGLDITFSENPKICQFSASCVDNIVTDICQNDHKVVLYDHCLFNHKRHYINIKYTILDD